MPERYSYALTKAQVYAHFHVSRFPDDYPVPLVATPNQLLPVITNHEPNQLQLLRWGLVPSWAQPTQQYSLINAKAEGIREKEAYKQPFIRRRCIVPASAFYVRQHTHMGQLPWAWCLPQHEPMGLAGLWDVWQAADEQRVHSFTIITVPAAGALNKMADRMPAILPPAHYATWLAGSTAPDALAALLQPWPQALQCEAASPNLFG